MNDLAQPRRRGRPPKPIEERKGANLTFRTRADFRERLEEAAAQSGRSVTEEVELRVERSFEMDRVVRRLDDLCSVFIDNGDDARKFVTTLMANVASIQTYKDKDGRQVGSRDWADSLPTQAGVRAGIIELLEHYAPEIDKEHIKSLSAQEQADIGRCRALATVWARMATGRANDLVEAIMRQNGTPS